jgi:hypothetical protein
MAQKVLLSGPFLFLLSAGVVTNRANLQRATLLSWPSSFIASQLTGKVMFHTTIRAAALALLTCSLVAVSCANASPATTADNEARLIGAWQKGLSPQLSQLAPERRQIAAHAGLLGAVIVYQADHRVEMYPPCGAKREALAAMGLQSASGTWALSASGELAVSVNIMGKSHDLKTSLQWQDGQIVMRDLSTGSVEKFGKYEGPLPPAC